MQIHLGMDIRQKIAPRDTRGHLGGFRGQPFKSQGKLSNGWTDWHQIWFTSVDSSGNGHILNTSHPSIPQGACRGGGGGHTFKSIGKLSNGWTDWHYGINHSKDWEIVVNGWSDWESILHIMQMNLRMDKG